MRKMTIILPDAASKEFELRDAILLNPTSRDSYLAFIDRANRMRPGLEAMAATVAKLRAAEGLTPHVAEGLAVLAGILPHLTEVQDVIEAFLEPHCVVHQPRAHGRVN